MSEELNPRISAPRALKTIQASLLLERFRQSLSFVSLHGPRFAFALPCPPLAVFAAFSPVPLLLSASASPTDLFVKLRFLRSTP